MPKNICRQFQPSVQESFHAIRQSFLAGMHLPSRIILLGMFESDPMYELVVKPARYHILGSGCAARYRNTHQDHTVSTDEKHVHLSFGHLRQTIVVFIRV